MQGSTQIGVQGICPPGWHVPTDGEYTTLTTYLGGYDKAGEKMKEAGNVHCVLIQTHRIEQPYSGMTEDRFVA